MGQNGAAELILDQQRRAARIVVLAPAVDVRVVKPVESLIEQAVGADVEQLELDLSNVSFADSAVVRLALKARDYVEPSGASVVIKAPPSVLRLFELTRTADLFAIVSV